MALLVWFTMGIALWHFTVFLPDRFWQGIVGAFLGAVLGAVIFGAIVEVASGKGLGETDVSTALTAIPGVAIGLAVVWIVGIRTERAAEWRSPGRRGPGPQKRSAGASLGCFEAPTPGRPDDPPQQGLA